LFKSELINPALFCNNLGVFFNTPIVMKITTKVMKNPVTPQKRHFVSRTEPTPDHDPENNRKVVRK